MLILTLFPRHVNALRSSMRAMSRGILMLGFILAGLFVVEQASIADPPVPVKRSVQSATTEGRVRPPLLREGGYLVQMPGEVSADTALGVHRFRPMHVEEGGIRRELILLPSRAMDDLLRLQAAQKDGTLKGVASVFEVTGRVLVYRGRNFLLADGVVVLERSLAEEDPPDVEELPNIEEEPLETDEDDLAKAIEARLEERIGAVPRSVDIAAAPLEANTPTYRGGSRLQERRGHIVRDPSSGTWRFVFEGSRTSMELLPCKELERLEKSTRQLAVPKAVTMSGRVTAFHGRNYLLPTAFRMASEGLGIGP